MKHLSFLFGILRKQDRKFKKNLAVLLLLSTNCRKYNLTEDNIRKYKTKNYLTSLQI